MSLLSINIEKDWEKRINKGQFNNLLFADEIKEYYTDSGNENNTQTGSESEVGKKVLNIKYKKKIYLRRMFFQKNVETSKLLTTVKSKNNILYAAYFVIFFWSATYYWYCFLFSLLQLN